MAQGGGWVGIQEDISSNFGSLRAGVESDDASLPWTCVQKGIGAHLIQFEWHKNTKRPDNPEGAVHEKENLCPPFSWIAGKP